MRRIIGYTLFWMGIGMLIAVIIPYVIISVIITAVLLLIGYNLFCC